MPVLAVQGDHVFEITTDTTMRQAAARQDHFLDVPEERPAELAQALLRFFGASR